MEIDQAISERFALLGGLLNERMRQLVAAAEAMSIGRGGVSKVARLTGVSRVGQTESVDSPDERIRKPGGGRKRAVDQDKTLLRDLEALIDPVTRGDPESPLRWTCKSLRTLSSELEQRGHQISHRLVSQLLGNMGYSLQANSKTHEGQSHPDRNAQFEFINRRTKQELRAGNPVISVDTKKKELVGNFKNSGREYRPKGQPQEVRVHDFVIPGLGRANPYGVYDLANDMGWVSVGVDHDTAAFAVESIRRWWRTMGAPLFPGARRLQIFADGGGSNGVRVRLWKVELQKLSEDLGFPIRVCHLRPATSKWNKIEHRLFSFISMNSKGQPLVSHEVIVNLIKATTTAEGLTVDAQVDDSIYPSGIKVSDEEMEQLNLKRETFHGDWNYTLSPRQRMLNL